MPCASEVTPVTKVESMVHNDTLAGYNCLLRGVRDASFDGEALCLRTEYGEGKQ